MSTRWKVFASIVSLSLLGVAAVGPTTATATGEQERPTRVLIIVLDQMRPDYVKRFDMDNVRSLMRGGVNFPQRDPRPHGGGDRHQPQRDHEWAVPQAHGMDERGLPRRRARRSAAMRATYYVTSSLRASSSAR